MASILSQSLLAGFLVFSCQTFAQSGPVMAVNGKMVPFNSKYVSAIDEKSRKEVLRSVRDTVDRNLKLGVKNIGSLSLDKFRKDIESVNLVVVQNGVQAIGTGQFTIRMGSVYYTESKSIYLNQESFRWDSRAVPNLIHEFLGALGYTDENYQISTILLSEKPQLYLKRIPDVGSFGSKLKKTPQSRVFHYDKGESSKNSGGTTVVGGGGDEVLLNAKVYMLNQFDLWREKVLPFVLKDPSVLQEVEPRVAVSKLLDPKRQDAYLKYFLQTPFENLTVKERM